jgi:peroxiredoxin
MADVHDAHFICHTRKKGRKERQGLTTMSDLLPIGSQAPDFSLAATDGQTITLSELAGHKHVVLVFYVGDNTPD